jgi:hypothetical protein
MNATIPAAAVSHDARAERLAGVAEVLPPQTMHAHESTLAPPRTTSHDY